MTVEHLSSRGRAQGLALCRAKLLPSVPTHRSRKAIDPETIALSKPLSNMPDVASTLTPNQLSSVPSNRFLILGQKTLVLIPIFRIRHLPSILTEYFMLKSLEPYSNQIERIDAPRELALGHSKQFMKPADNRWRSTEEQTHLLVLIDILQVRELPQLHQFSSGTLTPALSLNTGNELSPHVKHTCSTVYFAIKASWREEGPVSQTLPLSLPTLPTPSSSPSAALIREGTKRARGPQHRPKHSCPRLAPRLVGIETRRASSYASSS